jgi:hypothetical protein
MCISHLIVYILQESNYSLLVSANKVIMASKNANAEPPKMYVRTGLALPPKTEPFLDAEWHGKQVWGIEKKLVGNDLSAFMYRYNPDFLGDANKNGPQEHKKVQDLSGKYTAATKIDPTNHPLDEDKQLKFEYCVVKTIEGPRRISRAYCEYFRSNGINECPLRVVDMRS